MIGEQPRHESFADVVPIACLDRAQDGEVRVLEAHHLIEAEDALSMVAQRLRSGDDSDLACRRPDEAADQRPGRPARGDVVDPDIVMPAGARHVGDEGDDVGSASDQIVDRGPHALMVERHHRDPVIAAGQGIRGRSPTPPD